MTPYDTWIQNNPSLRKAIEQYYQQNKDLLRPYPDIAHRAEQIMHESAFYNQCAVLTIISAIRQL